MPRLRPSFRVLDPPGAVAQLPDLRRRRSAEAAVGVRRAVEHAGEVVLAPVGQRTHRSMWHLWRPARAGFLLDQLNSTRRWASGFGPGFPPSLRFRLRAKRSGATSTKLEERSRVGEARRSAKRGGGSRIGRNPPEGGRHVSAGSAGSALIVVGLDRDVRRRSTFEAVSAEV